MSLRHYLVSGRVQGVGFRRFVEKQGVRYGLTGIVRNLQDGRVEFIVEGEEKDLDQLEIAVKRGPMLSAVREVNRVAVERSGHARLFDPAGPIGRVWQKGAFAIAVDGEEPWINGTDSDKRN